MSTDRRVNIEANIKTRPAIPTMNIVARHPRATANNPAITGATILPRSPAKFTVPTAVERPRSS